MERKLRLNRDPVRGEFQDLLAEANHAHDRIAILPEERPVGDVMAAVEADREDHVEKVVLMPLAEATLVRDPAWVIRFAEVKAELLLTQGPRTCEQAAAWLTCAKQGYRAKGQQPAWAAQTGDLITEHRWRHKLRQLLEALR